MHFDRGRRHTRHRIGYGHRRVRVTAGVQHDAIDGKTNFVNPIDNFAFDIRLKIREFNLRKTLLQSGKITFEIGRTINCRLAFAQQIQIRTIDNYNFHITLNQFCKDTKNIVSHDFFFFFFYSFCNFAP